MKRYVASCSFGKDSMATVILALEHSEPLDEVTYCEVMFDEHTSGEVPEHREFVYEVAIPFLKEAGIRVNVVRGEKTFVGQFQHTIGSGQRAGQSGSTAWRSAGRRSKRPKRPAWRNVRDWVLAQVAIIEAGMVQIEEVFLPYMTDGSGRTLYQLYQGGRLALGGGQE